MIRISDNTWLNRNSINTLAIDKGVVRVFIGGECFEIEEEYLIDTLTGLNVDVGDVLAQLGRSEHEINS